MSIKLSPLNENQLKALEQLSEGLEKEQAIWLNGYFQGLTGAKLNGHAPQASNGESIPTAVEQIPLTILYGTHTGRCENLAKKLCELASGKGIDCKIHPMDDYKPRQLKDEKNLFVIVSTHGEGEPPEMAEEFHEFIMGKRLPKLNGLNYSVLALGDKSYKLFCQTGIDIDNALKKAGAAELYPIVKCDVDFEDNAESWTNAVIDKLASTLPAQTQSSASLKQQVESKTYTKKNPFKATVIDKTRITGRDSDKEVFHLEISLEDSGITYEPGDSLGIITENPPQLVNQIIEKLGVDKSELVETKEGQVPFEEALKHHVEISLLTRDVIQKYADKTQTEGVAKILEDDQLLDEYLYGYDVLDLLTEFPFEFTASAFIELLRPLPARLYSISSSQAAVEDEVHITVSRVNYNNKGRERVGACSSFLADRIEVDDELLIYIDKNPNFRLPLNGTPIIMVGAGTGIAPYRAFLQERETNNQKGNSWLFFGDRRFNSDFLYQLEWQKLLKKGYLEKIHLAFSRDQDEKIYVQHKLKENQEELFKWIEKGANFYLCGDMKYMAKDVQQTLLEIIQAQGGLTPEKAKEYFKKLKKEKRFQADVY